MKIFSVLLVLSLVLLSCSEDKKDDKKSKEEIKEEPKATEVDCDCIAQSTEIHNELTSYLEKTDIKEVVSNANLNALIRSLLIDIKNIEKDCHPDKTAEEMLETCHNFQVLTAAKADLIKYQNLIDEATK